MLDISIADDNGNSIENNDNNNDNDKNNDNDNNNEDNINKDNNNEEITKYTSNAETSSGVFFSHGFCSGCQCLQSSNCVHITSMHNL